MGTGEDGMDGPVDIDPMLSGTRYRNQIQRTTYVTRRIES